MNIFPNQNVQNPLCPRPIAPPVAPIERRRRLDGLEEGDQILVQTPAGICDQGIFIRLEDGFLIWSRATSGQAFLTITSLDEISITRL